MIDFEKMAQQMGDLDEHGVLTAACAVAEICPEQAPEALRAMMKGMDVVGERFELSEYFVGDLIFAGELFTEVMEMLRPFLNSVARTETVARKKVILATVEGDLHDIGKNIVKVVLEAKGFDVIDMGVNVSPAAIVNRVVREDARIIALSAVLTSAVDALKRTVDACVAAGIRERVKIVIGGAACNAVTARFVKADFYADKPEDTAAFCLGV